MALACASEWLLLPPGPPPSPKRPLPAGSGSGSGSDGAFPCSYIHVVDLACGHVAAVKKLEQTNVGCVPVNLGTGTAYSVLEMLAGVGKACGKTLPHKMCPRCARAANTHPSPQLSRAQAGRRCVRRRDGDVAACYCDPAFAKEFLGWEATRGAILTLPLPSRSPSMPTARAPRCTGYEEMCEDLWRWQTQNPDGFTTPSGSPRNLA